MCQVPSPSTHVGLVCRDREKRNGSATAIITIKPECPAHSCVEQAFLYPWMCYTSWFARPADKVLWYFSAKKKYFDSSLLRSSIYLFKSICEERKSWRCSWRCQDRIDDDSWFNWFRIWPHFELPERKKYTSLSYLFSNIQSEKKHLPRKYLLQLHARQNCATIDIAIWLTVDKVSTQCVIHEHFYQNSHIFSSSF